MGLTPSPLAGDLSLLFLLGGSFSFIPGGPVVLSERNSHVRIAYSRA